MTGAKAPRAWAKLTDENWLPLQDHGTDVAAVMGALLERGWLARLERAAGRSIERHERQVLLALAFVHDLGKCNAGFWRRQIEGSPLVGHTSIVLALDHRGIDWGRLPLLVRLLDRCGDELLRATLAHHGRPVVAPKEGLGVARHWSRRGGYDPLDELVALLETAQECYPAAFDTTCGALALPPAAVSLYAGLLTLADWLGSDSERFAIPGKSGKARTASSRACAAARLDEPGLGPGDLLAEAAMGATFGSCFGGDEPYESQVRAGDLNHGRVVVLEAETGSGRTEAASWRFLMLFRAGVIDGLYFALPTRTSAVQLHARVQRFLDRAFGEGKVEAVLAVPGYLRAGSTDGLSIARFETRWPDDPRELAEDARWAAESPKRYLAARVAVGTVDQVLMSGLKMRHSHLRSSCLSRSLLVVDEVHASDAYMTEILAGTLRNHVRAGGHAMLLSATLGASARTRLLGLPATACPEPTEAETIAYPALHDATGTRVVAAGHQIKEIRIELRGIISDPDAVATLALEAARRGALVLVVRNTVADAVATLRALEAEDADVESHLFELDGVPTLHHGRFAPADRRRLDTRIEEVFGKARSAGARGVVAVGTQTLEMSLDLDADLLLTDLAPMDVLLQRFGRLHRHVRADRPQGFAVPSVVVATPAERDLTPFFGKVRDRHGLGPFDGAAGGVYPNIACLEATWRLLGRGVMRTPSDNRVLVEQATHPALLDAIERELGWSAFGAKREGAQMSDLQLARHHALDLARPFDEEFVFPAGEENVRTRLGTPGWQLDVAPPGTGPFGPVIDAVVVPGWMLDGVPPDEAVTPTNDDEGFAFRVGNREFRYDRFGLARTA